MKVIEVLTSYFIEFGTSRVGSIILLGDNGRPFVPWFNEFKIFRDMKYINR